jgi:hypothetical protein
VEGGVHPTRAPQLLTIGKFSTDPSQTIGEDTRITVPDPNNYNSDLEVGTVRGGKERATLGLAIRDTAVKSVLMGWKNKRCRVDIFALAGRCANPQDFTNGWEKMRYFPDGQISSHSFENFGAYGTDENNPTNEMVDMTAEDYWEFLEIGQEQIGSTVTTRVISAVDVYTGDPCEACPEPCDRILAAMAGASATPGTKPSLLYSADGGVSFTTDEITGLFSNEGVADGEVIGGDIVYISYEGAVLTYTNIDQLYENTNTWQRVSQGFVAGKGPRKISSADPRHTWIVGDGGYVYFMQNHKTGVSVQNAGVTTTQHLQAVHAMNTENVLAVGNSNAVIFTKNGGVTWKSVTGPAVGVNLGACWMWDANTWFVGEGAGGTGKLWLTANAGLTWTQVLLPATYGRIYQIRFVSDAEGYISATAGGDGYVLRTVTAGNEWKVLPEGKSAVPVSNAYLLDLAICSQYDNTVYAGGLAGDLSAGILLKMTA